MYSTEQWPLHDTSWVHWLMLIVGQLIQVWLQVAFGLVGQVQVQAPELHPNAWQVPPKLSGLQVPHCVWPASVQVAS